MKGFKGALLFILGLMLAVAQPARAQTYSGVYVDPAFPGTGFSIEQQGTGLFLAWYAYTDGGQPYWLVSTMTLNATTGVATGALQEVTGTGFGPNFQPSTVAARNVGTATLTFTTAATGTLSFTANNRSGVYSIQRYAVGTVSLAGTYIGATIIDSNNCPGGVAGDRNPANITISLNGSVMTMRIQETAPGGDTCTVTASTVNFGGAAVRLDGTFSCTSGNAGTARNAILVPNQRGFSGTLSFQPNAISPACTVRLGIGGVK